MVKFLQRPFRAQGGGGSRKHKRVVGDGEGRFDNLLLGTRYLTVDWVPYGPVEEIQKSHLERDRLSQRMKDRILEGLYLGGRGFSVVYVSLSV